MKIGKAMHDAKKGEELLIDVDEEFIAQAILEKLQRGMEEEKMKGGNENGKNN